MPNHAVPNPSRAELSEAKYRTYESMFMELLTTFPAPLRLRPTRGALSTLVVRLREAANAVLHNSDKFLDPILIDLETFRSVWSKVRVSIRGDEVIIAEPSAIADVARAQLAERATSKPLFTISNPTLSELEVFAAMFQRRACADPFLFVGEVPAFTPPIGVAFEQTTEGWMML